MIAADFFSGLGGFTEGARAAGVAVRLAINHDADAVAWHSRNHAGTEHVQQDLGELDMRALPELDLLLASPCCQGFTPSGRPGQSTAHRVDRAKILARRQVARNTSYAVLAAADVARPRRILVENVVDFLAWAGFPAWRSMLEAHGYTVRVHRILASNYGGAQDRERALITAGLGGPIDLAPTWGTQRRAIGDCLLDDDDARCQWVPLDSKTRSIRERVKAAARRAGRRFTWANVDSAIGRTEEEHFATFTTKTLSQLHLVDGDRVRRLEARELARGMSFPDSYELPASRSLAGRLIGNAIDCRVAQGVVEQAAEWAA